MEGDPVAGESGRLRMAPKYRAWKRTLRDNGCSLRQVELLSELNKPDGSLLFALLRTRVEDPRGRPLPAYALIRGHAVLIVTMVVDAGSGERKFLMLRQRRIGHGGETLEFPAGMLDEDVDDPVGVAIRELKEETGLDVAPGQIFPLSDRPLYSSPGLDDEAIHYFGCVLELPSRQFGALEGGETGQTHENEFIRLALVEYQQALAEVDSLQVRLGFSLFFEYRDRQAPEP
ncbi:MAG: NUDIX hydrolase [Fibrobacteria bacterium]